MISTVGGIDLHWEACGEGEPLVFLHGMMGCGADWRHMYRDALYPVALAFELHRAIPRSRLWVVPDGGHAPVFGEAAAQFATTALAFLRGAWR